VSITIGVIGAGTIGRALAAHAAKAGRHVLISNSRGPETLADIAAALGPAVEAITVAKAADADVVVLAVPFVAVPDAAAAAGDWTGQSVVDVTNQFATATYEGRADIGELTGSEWVAGHLPGAHIIKAFNAMAGLTSRRSPGTPKGGRSSFTPAATSRSMRTSQPSSRHSAPPQSTSAA
jgi:8-hydroxy-5-deazaflavin:NADPH oxidoreductase